MYLCRARLSARLASLCAYSRSHCAGRRRYTRTSHALIDVLLRNPELDTASAKQEIQWMADQIYGSCRTTTEPSAQLHQGYLEQLVQRRAAGEPLQYVLGSTDFGPLTLTCRAPVLIPRPETADITTRFSTLLDDTRIRALDLCTGSGCIALLLAYLSRNAHMTAVDISDDALALARDNAARCDLSERMDIQRVDIMDDASVDQLLASGPFDVITANPPYITVREYQSLPVSVKDHEDPRALIGSMGSLDDGLAFYRRIAHLVPRLLSTKQVPGPCLMMEIGHEQGEEVRGILEEVQTLRRLEVWDDMYGRPRAVVGWTG